jgi:hypothetical protein
MDRKEDPGLEKRSGPLIPWGHPKSGKRSNNNGILDKLLVTKSVNLAILILCITFAPDISAAITTNAVPRTTQRTVTTTQITSGTAVTTTKAAYNNYAENYIEKSLGFVLPTDRLYIPKTLRKQRIGVVIEVETEETFYDRTLEAANALLLGIKDYQMFKGGSKESKALNEIHKGLQIKIKKLFKQFFMLAQHAETGITTNETLECNLAMPAITYSRVSELELDLAGFLPELDKTITDPISTIDYRNSAYYLLHAERAIESLLELTTDRLILLENLNSHIIPDRLPILLQTQKCYSPGKLESIDVETCKITGKGLVCILEITAQTQTEPVTMMELINYDGVQLDLGNKNNILVQGQDNHLNIMQCKNDKPTYNELEDLNDCILIPLNKKCADVINTKDFNAIMQNCNFTFANTEPIVNYNDGVLINERMETIKELQPTGNRVIVGIINPEFPMTITTNALLSIHYKGQEVIIRPDKVYRSRILTHTWLTNEQRQELTDRQNMKRLVKAVGHGEVIDAIMALLFLIMAPGMIYYYKIIMATSEATVNCKKTKKQKHAHTNYEANKKFVTDKL